MKVAVALLLFALPASAQTVVDGDTIKLAGTTYRLWGIDAPESKQSCAAGWPAGQEATKARAVRAAGATPKAPPAQLPAIELLLGGRRSARHLPPTF
jgi:hypothetical protein